MSFFADLYNLVIYRPLLNILQGLYIATDDIGISIIILGAVVNFLMWPLFAQAYINGQKTKVLQPLLRQIREENKDNPQEMLKKLGEFNKKHGIRNNSIFIVLIFQLIFASGLWSMTRRISSSELVEGMVRIPGLYPEIFGTSETSFDKVAFGFLNIGDGANSHIWLPILAAFLSFLYGYYTFRIAPKPNVIKVKPPKKDRKKKKEEDNKPQAFDPEALQKSMEVQTIFVIPIFMFVLNLSLTTGVNIYFTTISLLSLVRQIFLTNYYAGHTDRLIDQITKSDPSLNDDDPTNDIEITASGDITSQEEVPEVLLNQEKSKTTRSNKGVKSKTAKSKKKKPSSSSKKSKKGKK